MIVEDFCTDVAQRATQSSSQTATNNETLQTHLVRQFNLFHKDFNKRYAWPWRQKQVFVQSVANYVTGTVSVTNGSRTVTGAGTAWTSAMAGRILKLDSDDELYEILSVSGAGTLVLKTPYLGASSGGASYLIWKKYYELDPAVPYLSDMTIARWPYTSKEIPKKSFDGNLIRGWETNNMNMVWTWGGVDNSILRYSGGGAITVTALSRIVVGVATTFLTNVFAGSRLTIGTEIYNVDTVDSDTQLTLVQMVKTAVTSSTDFTIESKGRSRIQLSSVPNPQINMLINFSEKTYDLGLKDEPKLWEGHEHIITDVMYGYLLEKLTSDKAFAWYDVYRAKIKEAWINLNERDSIEQAPRVQRRGMTGYRPTIYSD